MRDNLCLFFLLFLFSCNVCAQEEKERVGNPDDLAKIERPCPTFDLNCIRVFFQKHAHCTKAFGPGPDPLFRPEAALDLPRLNWTITVQNLMINGINGRVEEFFINRETDNLVIAIEFRNLNQVTDKAFFTFYRRAKEPVVTTGFVSVSYQSFVITAVIPKIDDLQLDKAECTTFSNDATPTVIVGPTAAVSSDPQVQLAVAEFFADIPTDVQEVFLPDSFYYAATFIQYNICDFGLLAT